MTHSNAAIAARPARLRAGELGKALDNGRTDHPAKPDRHELPEADQRLELPVLGVQFRHRLPVPEPVVPVELHRTSTPLFLEAEGAFTGRGTTEVEHTVTFLAGKGEDAPVEQRVRTEAVVPPQGRGPGDLEH